MPADDGECGVGIEKRVAENVLREVVYAFARDGVGDPFRNEDGKPGVR